MLTDAKPIQTNTNTSFFLNFFIVVPECAQGFYGLGCQYRCSCANNAPCDSVSGTCKCGPGWRGTACNEGDVNKLLIVTTAMQFMTVRLSQSLNPTTDCRIVVADAQADAALLEVMATNRKQISWDFRLVFNFVFRLCCNELLSYC